MPKKPVPEWLKHIYLCASPVQYPRRKEGGKMERMLSELVEGLTAQPAEFQDVGICGITCDSRKVQPGMLFVAFPGSKKDGRTFVDEAIRRGCSAVVCQEPLPGCLVPVIEVPRAREAMADLAVRFHGDPTSRLNVVGVTGTNGKTTTAYLLRAIFEAAGEKAGMIGTIQHAVGGRLLPSDNTTPGADTLQAFFAEMAAAGCRSAAMEVSSHALDQGRVRGTRFAAGVFTNLTRDHLDYHPTFEAYREAKGLLFKGLSSNAVAAINTDDPAGAGYAARTGAHVVTYGLRHRADVSATVDQVTFHGTRLRMRLGSEERVLQIRLVGTHNVYNILGAAACTWAMGYDIDAICAGIEGVAFVPGRLEPVDVGQDFAVLVDYAHTDDALRNVMTFLRPLVRGRLLVVFGCGGDRDRGKRPKMGGVAEELADLAIVTSDNPRSEDPNAIIEEILSGTGRGSKFHVEPDRRMAIKLALSLAQKDDVVLIAGKGHETVQIFQDQSQPFDDRLMAREVLSGRERNIH